MLIFDIVIGTFIAIIALLSIGKYRYDNGISKYSKK